MEWNTGVPKRTQVGIVGAGPAGLMLAHLLRAEGIESVVLESRDRAYVEGRVRAGVLEQGTVDLLGQLGLDGRMKAQGLSHHGIELGFHHTRHRIDLSALTGKAVTVYGQHEVVKDLIQAMQDADMPLLFEVNNVTLHGLQSETPSVCFEQRGESYELYCDYIAGCDGFHGISRPTVPNGVLTTYDRVYPFSWLGILAEAPPSQNELVYMNSERGFALFSMRSPTVTRLYLQCEPTTDIKDWSDDGIWSELFARFECNDGWKPNHGTILQKSITPMRSFVTEPMQYGRLFLAGDAVHIVPPTGAKGMNLAISDVKVLSEALAVFYRSGNTDGCERYSATCLRRIWKAQRFSWWMTSMLHRDPNGNSFDHRRQLAELDYVTSSAAAAKSLAENYVGLPFESAF
jgi:p-hydroxybenzoate 3-monooxygenase